MADRIQQSNPVAEALWRRLDRDFAEQLAGTTPPVAPEPIRKPEPTIPQWPARISTEL